MYLYVQDDVLQLHNFMNNHEFSTDNHPLQRRKAIALSIFWFAVIL